jgi:hypothetical protein
MSKLIEKEGKHYIKGKVVMLGTIKSNNIGDVVKCPITNRLAQLNVLTYQSEQPSINQHLYIISDDEIKEGDWYLDTTLEQVIRANINSDHNVYIGSCKKIIATTNAIPFVTPSNENSGIYKYCVLPQPSESFIKAYIEAYNNGNVIEDVLIEVEKTLNVIQSGGVGFPEDDIYQTIVKPKLKENNIIIKKVKDSWSRDEVCNLLNEYRVYTWKTGSTAIDLTKWIEENL